MTLADKLIRLRKRSGWSQEELAEKLDLSRQAVSKWEAGQTTPDLEKILQLSELFGVTTDYLLKDTLEQEERPEGGEQPPVHKVSPAQAEAYLDLRRDAAPKIALGTLLCILSAVPLLLLSAASATVELPFSQNAAVGAGVIAIFPIVAAAVMLFLQVGFRDEAFAFLQSEPFQLEHGAAEMVRQRQKAFRGRYVRFNYIGICICVLSPLPLLCAAFSGREFLIVAMLCITMLAAGIGAAFLIAAGVQWSAMQRLLQEGQFAAHKDDAVMETIGDVYWLLATAVYLGWSLPTRDWGTTWIVWPIAGLLFAVLCLVCKLWLGARQK